MVVADLTGLRCCRLRTHVERRRVREERLAPSEERNRGVALGNYEVRTIVGLDGGESE